jgi:hypothetical protein
MTDLQRIQQQGTKWKLDFGEDGQHDVILRLPLQFIIGDCEGHDKLVGMYLLEQSLGFYEWTMQREHKADTILGADGTTESSTAQRSIRRYMFLLKHTCPREEMGKNFKMTKFHQSLHFVPNIGLHGSLRNTDSSPPESIAKGNVKDPASHTQRVTSKLTFQTGKRYMETLTFREFKRLKSECGHETEGKPYINKCTVEQMLSDNRRPIIHDHDTLSIFTGGTRF